MNMNEFNSLEGANYGNPPNDGAKYACSDCGRLFRFNECIVARVNNNSMILCMDCVDEHWLQLANNRGQLEFPS